MKWSLIVLVLLGATPAAAQRFSGAPQPQRFAPRQAGPSGYGIHSGAPNADSDRAHAPREELAPVGAMRQKLRAPELLAEALSTPQDAFREGRPWPLVDALARSPDRQRQVHIAQLYWKLAAAQADYHFARDLSHQLWRATERHAHTAATQAARYHAEGAVNDAEVTVVDAQHELAEALALHAEEPLPLALDRPHVGDYKTHYDELFVSHSPPPRLRLTHRSLPVRRKAIDVHGDAILAAQDALDSTIEEHERQTTDLTTLLAAFNELDRQRRAFVKAVRDYNQDIAEYALTVAPHGAQDAALVAMLIKSPSPAGGVRDADRRASAGHNSAIGRDVGPAHHAGGGPTSRTRAAVGGRTFEQPETGNNDGYEHAAPRGRAGDEYGAAPNPYRSQPNEGYPARAPAYNDNQGPNYNEPRAGNPYDRTADPNDNDGSTSAPNGRYAPPAEGYGQPPDNQPPDNRYAPPGGGYRSSQQDPSRPAARRGGIRADAAVTPAMAVEPAAVEPAAALAPPDDPAMAGPGADNPNLLPEPVSDDAAPGIADPFNRDAGRREARKPTLDAPAGDEPLGEPDPFVATRRHETMKPPLGASSGRRVPGQPTLAQPKTVPAQSETGPGDFPEAVEPGTSPSIGVVPATATSPDQGEYGGLEHVSPALRAQRLSGILHWWERALPAESGQPTSLKTVVGKASVVGRRQAIDAYWQAREAAARYQAIAAATDQMAPLGAAATRRPDSPGAASGMLRLQAARVGLQSSLLDAHIDLLAAEFALAMAAGAPLDREWFLPTTVPHAGRYRVPESHLVHRAASYSADRLPPMAAALQEMAAAVVFADAARAEAASAANGNPAAINAAIERVYDQLTDTEAFLRAQTDYNLAIASYALRTLPAGAPPEQVLSRLVIARELRDGA